MRAAEAGANELLTFRHRERTLLGEIGVPVTVANTRSSRLRASGRRREDRGGTADRKRIKRNSDWTEAHIDHRSIPLASATGLMFGQLLLQTVADGVVRQHLPGVDLG